MSSIDYDFLFFSPVYLSAIYCRLPRIVTVWFSQRGGTVLRLRVQRRNTYYANGLLMYHTLPSSRPFLEDTKINDADINLIYTKK
jgi:hypothetical protein